MLQGTHAGTRVYLDDPVVGSKEKEYLAQAIDSSYVSTIGPFVAQFEKAFAEYVQASWAVATQSGTAALHSTLRELGIGKGDEVIVPVLTFVATVNPVMYVGATPVFADVDPKTWNIDPDEMVKVISPRTKAIIPVHLYGNPSAMDQIMAIAKTYGLAVIEDATESLGARFQGAYTGTWGDFGCFSFNGNKLITTGGGGMVTGKNREQLAHIKFLSNQARDEQQGYYHPEIGFNYRMTNLEAAMGLGQMQQINEFLARKKQWQQVYEDRLKGTFQFQQAYPEGERSSWLVSGCMRQGTDIAKMCAACKEQGIPLRRIFMPIVEFPPYQQFRRGNYPNAYEIYHTGICLPSSARNTREGIEYACERILEWIKKN